MKRTNLDIMREEIRYATPCSLPENEQLFLSEPRGTRANKSKIKREAACASCLVRLECLTDAVNVLLDANSISSHISSGYQAGKTPDEQVELAKTFRNLGVSQITVDDLDGFPPAAIGPEDS